MLLSASWLCPAAVANELNHLGLGFRLTLCRRTVFPPQQCHGKATRRRWLTVPRSARQRYLAERALCAVEGISPSGRGGLTVVWSDLGQLV